MLTWKSASRHNGVHFFDVSTSKSAPNLGVLCTFWLGNVLGATTASTFSTSQLPKAVRHWGCFVYFYLDMCFAPQRHALFRHLNFQKCFENGVLCTFWLGHVLHATTASSQKCAECEVLLAFSLANVLRATTACNFSSLIWPDGSAPRRFSEPTFRPSGTINHWKKQSEPRLSYFFAPASSFFSLFLFSDLLSSAPLFSGSSHLCFSSSPYCRKFDF